MPGVLKDSFTTNNDTAEVFSNVNATLHGLGQVFTPASSYNLGAFEFSLKKTGLPTGNIKGRLYAVDGSDLPTGSALAETEAIDLSVLTTSSAYYSFNLIVPYPVLSGTKYAIVFELFGAGQSYDGSNRWDAQDSNAAGYAGGAAIGKSNLDVWAAVGAGIDLVFKTYDVSKAGFFHVM